MLFFFCRSPKRLFALNEVAFRNRKPCGSAHRCGINDILNRLHKHTDRESIDDAVSRFISAAAARDKLDLPNDLLSFNFRCLLVMRLFAATLWRFAS